MKEFRLFDETVCNKEILSTTWANPKRITAANSVFKNVKVKEVRIESIIADKCRFDNCDLNNVHIARGAMQKCLFSGICFYSVNLTNVNFKECTFERCSLRDAHYACNLFEGCTFLECDLPKSDRSFFSSTLLTGTNAFSQSAGWPSPSEFLAQNFERNEANTGYIVYKTFFLVYPPPKKWEIIPGSIITENCDLERWNRCSYGINVATLKWLRDNGVSLSASCIWRCEILDEWLADVCVPIDSDGKIRCGKLRLIETI